MSTVYFHFRGNHTRSVFRAIVVTPRFLISLSLTLNIQKFYSFFLANEFYYFRHNAGSRSVRMTHIHRPDQEATETKRQTALTTE
jgi:hypothetical protein